MNTNSQTQRSGAVTGSSSGLHFPADMIPANDLWGATCGHFALAAALGVDVINVVKYFPGLRQGKTWCSVKTMEEALHSIPDVMWKSSYDVMPRATGVVIIQGLGPWMNKGVPFGARLSRTHWVASFNDHIGSFLVADANGKAWMPLREWESTILAEILQGWKATGWQVKRGYEVSMNGGGLSGSGGLSPQSAPDAGSL